MLFLSCSFICFDALFQLISYLPKSSLTVDRSAGIVRLGSRLSKTNLPILASTLLSILWILAGSKQPSWPQVKLYGMCYFPVAVLVDLSNWGDFVELFELYAPLNVKVRNVLFFCLASYLTFQTCPPAIQLTVYHLASHQGAYLYSICFASLAPFSGKRRTASTWSNSGNSRCISRPRSPFSSPAAPCPRRLPSKPRRVEVPAGQGRHFAGFGTGRLCACSWGWSTASQWPASTPSLRFPVNHPKTPATIFFIQRLILCHDWRCVAKRYVWCEGSK